MSSDLLAGITRAFVVRVSTGLSALVAVAAALVAVAATWLVLAVGPALALDVHPYLCQITGTSPGSASECHTGGSAATGGLGFPSEVTLSGGDLWVASPGTPAVDEFDASGAFVSQIPRSGPGYGFAGSARGVARDDATGQVYVADSGPDVVDVFNNTGGFVAKWNGTATPSGSFGNGQVAAAVDNSADGSAGDVYVLDTTHDVIDKLDSSGNPVSFSGSAPYISASQLTGTPSGAFKFSNSTDALAVDSSGDIWVADAGNAQVDEFSSDGTFIQSISGTGTPTGSFGQLGGVAVDNATGDVYVVDSGNEVVDEFSGSGAFLSQVSGAVTPAGAFNPQGVAVDSSGNVYVTDGANNVIDKFSSGMTVVPDVTAAAAANVGETGAALSGTVNPDALAVTSCEFEYGTSSSALTQTAPCSPDAAAIGSGSGEVAVTADLTGLQDDTTYFFRLAAGNVNDVNRTAVQSFTTLGPPQIQIPFQAVSKVTETSAILHTSVNPFGTDSTCEFQYGTDTSYSGGSVPCTPADLGAGEGAVSASATLTGLAPGTTYHFRVVATSALGTVDGTDQTFTTLPSILATYTTGLTGSGVDLNAQINPGGLDTTYHFEWGTTTAYGNTIPVPDADIGTGTSAQTVTQDVTGLKAGTVYHWRLVVTNSFGTRASVDNTFVYQTAVPSGAGCPNAQFRTGQGAGLPDCRAYEQVSPVDKDGFDVGFPAQGVAVDGNAISYYSAGAFAGQQGNNGLLNWYLSSREGAGWSTAGLEPPVYNPSSLTAVAQYEGWSPDLQHMIVEEKVTGGPQDIYLRNPDGSFTLVNKGAPVVTGGGDVTTMYEGASPDFSHILFAPTEDSSVTDEWVNGTVTPVAPTVIQSQCTTGETGQSGPGGNCATGSVSLSPTQFVNADGYATSIALFKSSQELTNDANTGPHGGGADLYEYNAQTGTLTDLSPDSNAADTLGADVGGILAASQNGSYVYFAADGVLKPGAPSGATCNFPANTTCNLYAWHDGSVAFITTLNGNDENDWRGADATVTQASGDGTRLVFTSHTSLTGYDNAGFGEVYVYDTASDSLSCVSCNPSGAAATGDAELSQSQGTGTIAYPDQTNISTDGSRVFFESADALVSGDTDGAHGCALAFKNEPSCLDVYEWEADGAGSCRSAVQNGGCLYLISTGQSDAASFFEGANPSGSDVFFATRDQLVAQDTDGNYDVYDARVDGGIAAQQSPAPPASCSGSACQGAASPQPQLPTAASVTFTGPGNVAATATAKASVLSRTVRGDTFMVRVRAPGRGMITVTGAAIRTVRHAAARAGTYGLKVTLTANAKRELKPQHKLKLMLRVAFAPAGAKASVATVRLTVEPAAVRHATRRHATHQLGGAR